MKAIQKHSPELKWAEGVSRFMDAEFRLPGTKFKFGLDPLLGLLPVIGEAGTFLISGAIMLALARHGASRKVVILMAVNVVIDAIIGSIPVIGWLFDFFFKANERNVRLLKSHYEEGKHQGSGTGILVIIALVMLAFLALLIYGLWKLTEYIFSYF